MPQLLKRGLNRAAADSFAERLRGDGTFVTVKQEPDGTFGVYLIGGGRDEITAAPNAIIPSAGPPPTFLERVKGFEKGFGKYVAEPIGTAVTNIGKGLSTFAGVVGGGPSIGPDFESMVEAVKDPEAAKRALAQRGGELAAVQAIPAQALIPGMALLPTLARETITGAAFGESPKEQTISAALGGVGGAAFVGGGAVLRKVSSMRSLKMAKTPPQVAAQVADKLDDMQKVLYLDDTGTGKSIANEAAERIEKAIAAPPPGRFDLLVGERVMVPRLGTEPFEVISESPTHIRIKVKGQKKSVLRDHIESVVKDNTLHRFDATKGMKEANDILDNHIVATSVNRSAKEVAEAKRRLLRPRKPSPNLLEQPQRSLPDELIDKRIEHIRNVLLPNTTNERTKKYLTTKLRELENEKIRRTPEVTPSKPQEPQDFDEWLKQNPTPPRAKPEDYPLEERMLRFGVGGGASPPNLVTPEAAQKLFESAHKTGKTPSQLGESHAKVLYEGVVSKEVQDLVKKISKYDEYPTAMIENPVTMLFRMEELGQVGIGRYEPYGPATQELGKKLSFMSPNKLDALSAELNNFAKNGDKIYEDYVRLLGNVSPDMAAYHKALSDSMNKYTQEMTLIGRATLSGWGSLGNAGQRFNAVRVRAITGLSTLDDIIKSPPPDLAFAKEFWEAYKRGEKTKGDLFLLGQENWIRGVFAWFSVGRDLTGNFAQWGSQLWSAGMSDMWALANRAALEAGVSRATVERTLRGVGGRGIASLGQTRNVSQKAIPFYSETAAQLRASKNAAKFLAQKGTYDFVKTFPKSMQPLLRDAPTRAGFNAMSDGFYDLAKVKLLPDHEKSLYMLERSLEYTVYGERYMHLLGAEIDPYLYLGLDLKARADMFAKMVAGQVHYMSEAAELGYRGSEMDRYVLLKSIDSVVNPDSPHALQMRNVAASVSWSEKPVITLGGEEKDLWLLPGFGNITKFENRWVRGPRQTQSAIKTFVAPFLRFWFQVARQTAKRAVFDPEFMSKLYYAKKGEHVLTGHDFARYMHYQMEGAGTVFGLGAYLYHRTDFDTMEANLGGYRVSVNHEPLPEALFLYASFRGDHINAGKAWGKSAMNPFSGGIVQPVISALNDWYGKGKVVPEKVTKDLIDTLAVGFPAERVARSISNMFDPTQRRPEYDWKKATLVGAGASIAAYMVTRSPKIAAGVGAYAGGTAGALPTQELAGAAGGLGAWATAGSPLVGLAGGIAATAGAQFLPKPRPKINPFTGRDMRRSEVESLPGVPRMTRPEIETLLEDFDIHAYEFAPPPEYRKARETGLLGEEETTSLEDAFMRVSGERVERKVSRLLSAPSFAMLTERDPARARQRLRDAINAERAKTDRVIRKRLRKKLGIEKSEEFRQEFERTHPQDEEE